MLIVGPSKTCAPLDLASSASAAPISYTRSRFQVAPSAMPTGKLADFTPPISEPPPRAPFGPSVTRSLPTPRWGIAGSDQKSSPESNATCSASVISSTICSMVLSVMVSLPWQSLPHKPRSSEFLYVEVSGLCRWLVRTDIEASLSHSRGYPFGHCETTHAHCNGQEFEAGSYHLAVGSTGSAANLQS